MPTSGGGQSNRIVRGLGRSDQDARSRMLESVGIVEAKERDNLTIKLAINVTCH